MKNDHPGIAKTPRDAWWRYARAGLAAVLIASVSCPIPAAKLDFRVPADTSDADQRLDTGQTDTGDDLEGGGDNGDDLEVAYRGTTERVIGLRFANVNVYRNAVITNAYITFTINEARSGTTNLTIRGQAVDDAPVFANTANNISGRTTTSASVNWTVQSWDQAVSGTTNDQDIGGLDRTPNIASIVQEIVNRPGWNPGQAMAFIIRRNTGATCASGDANCRRDMYSFGGGSNRAAYLHIEIAGYRPPLVGDNVDNGNDICYVAADDQNRVEILALRNGIPCPATGGTINRGQTCQLRSSAGTSSLELKDTGRNPEALELDPTDGTLYTFDRQDNVGGVASEDYAYLGRVNVDTGQFFPLPEPVGRGSGCRSNGTAATLLFNDFDGLAFDPSTGHLYATDTGDSASDSSLPGERYLIRIDKDTGALVPNAFVSPANCTDPGEPGADGYVDYLPITGLTDASGVALDQSDDIAFDPILTDGAGRPVLYVTTAARLMTVNRDTGVVTSVGVFRSSTLGSVVDMEGMSIDASGQLYGSTGAVGGAGVANRFWTADKSDTDGDGYINTYRIDNSGTDVTPLGSDYEGIACMFVYNLTHAVVGSFRGYTDGGGTTLEWTTVSEQGSVAFHVERFDEDGGGWVRVNENPVVASMLQQGATYRISDPGASSGQSYKYRVIEEENTGRKRRYGPYRITIDGAGFGSLTVAGEVANLRGGEGVINVRKIAAERKAELKAKREARKQARRALRAGKLAGAKKAASAVAKISIEQPGMYFVSDAALGTALGLTGAEVAQKAAQGKLDFSNRGVSVAYLPVVGGVWFNGEAVDSIYTNENVYWVRQAKGKLMRQEGGSGPAPAPANQSFRTTAHAEQDVFPAPFLFQDPEADFWFWGALLAGSGPTQFLVDLPGAVGNGSAELTVHLHGATDLANGNDHHVVVRVNGTEVGSVIWDGIRPMDGTFTVSQTLLLPGANTVEVEAVLDAGVPASVVWVDGFDVTYQRTYQAANDMLRARGGGHAVITATGFSGGTINVFDVSDPKKPVKVNAVTQGAGSVSFKPKSADAEYLVVGAGGVLAAGRIEQDEPSNLAAKSNSADYVVIAPDDFLAAAQGLADYRAGGYSTLVVDLENVYDEFNHGIADPRAVNAFLKQTRKWSGKPKYAVLVGKGTFDHKDIFQLGTNIFPVWMAATPNGLFASDNRYGDFDNDGVPDIVIGRIPALTPQQVTDYVAKLQAYEANAGAWKKNVLMLADNVDDPAANFSADSDALAALLPGDRVVQKYYYDGVTNPSAANQSVEDAINAGLGMFNYIGHGAVTQLADEALLSTTDVPGLSNGTTPFLFNALTCAVGNDSYPGFDSLSEMLVMRTTGGAIAAFSPTGLSDHSPAVLLNQRYFETQFGDGTKTYGEAAVEALRRSAQDRLPVYMRSIYGIQGDPALQVQ